MQTPSAAGQFRRIDRREAILRVSALLGGAALVGGRGLLAACERASLPLEEATLGDFTAADIALLDEIAETILPATKTPGAKAAKTGAFMALMVTDSYHPAEQRVFREGMRKVDDAMRRASGISFMAATPAQRSAVLIALDLEQKRAMEAREAAAPEGTASAGRPAHYFRMMKELALLGYFTSEVGCTQALRFAETPGRFDACIPYAPGEPAWADHA
ncbi:MAG: gluconate 2-dehydrogenase subunit 3 family protein [Steroidobacteraceae bacterium]